MGVFTRTRDIVNANINAMLDKAENPEKMIRFMAREMEETLGRVKAARGGAMAARHDIETELSRVCDRVDVWADRARLAVDKGRDDLAREALIEKRRYLGRTDALERERMQADALVGRYQEDIDALEAKLKLVMEKKRMLVQRHVRAGEHRRAQYQLRRLDTSRAMQRFHQFEHRIECMEAEADLVNFGRRPSLEEEFAGLGADEEIEHELEELKASAVN
ncbi:MAG: PspA/IM30 family protein [Candidatus Hydrogenedentota bacterium]